MARRRYGIDEKRIAQWIKDGRGQGQGKDYKPWLTMRDVASYGRSSRPLGATTGRKHELLSDNERAVFLVLDASEAVVDIREQFPLPREDTIRIAAEMGVRHPQDGGVDVVMTTDFLVDIRVGKRVRRQAITVKPWSRLDDRRTIEKFEIERRYWLSQSVPWQITTDLEIAFDARMVNLWVQDMTTFDHHEAPHPGYWPELCESLLAALAEAEPQPLRDFLGRLEAEHQSKPGDGLAVIRHLLRVGRLGLTQDGRFEPRGLTGQLTVRADVEHHTKEELGGKVA